MENNDSTVPPWLWRHSHVSFLLLLFPNTLNNMNAHAFIHCKWMNVKKTLKGKYCLNLSLIWIRWENDQYVPSLLVEYRNLIGKLCFSA